MAFDTFLLAAGGVRIVLLFLGLAASDMPTLTLANVSSVSLDVAVVRKFESSVLFLTKFAEERNGVLGDYVSVMLVGFCSIL